jgi:hypothetical protein
MATLMQPRAPWRHDLPLRSPHMACPFLGMRQHCGGSREWLTMGPAMSTFASHRPISIFCCLCIEASNTRRWPSRDSLEIEYHSLSMRFGREFDKIAWQRLDRARHATLRESFQGSAILSFCESAYQVMESVATLGPNNLLSFAI